MLFRCRLGVAERTGWKEGAQACVISTQTGVSGWAVAGYSAGFLFFFGVVVSFLPAIPHIDAACRIEEKYNFAMTSYYL